MHENDQEKKVTTPQVQQEQQAMQDEAKQVENREPTPKELPADNRGEHPQRQLG